MRDKCDLTYLQDSNAFDSITVPVPLETIEKLQRQYKLTNVSPLAHHKTDPN